MAKIKAGVATSHVPAIGAAIDNKKTGDHYWKPLFAGYDYVKEWVKDAKPDVVILVYNDHASAFDANFALNLYIQVLVETLYRSANSFT